MAEKEIATVVRKKEVLKNLATYDPELAEELAMSEEPLEQVIAQELAMWRIIKNERLKNMDLETLLTAFDFFKDMMKLALAMFTSANQMFFMQFLQQYEYVAGAVSEALKSENPPPPTPKEIIAMKIAENMDKLFENIEQLQKNMMGGVSNVGKEKEEGNNTRSKSGRRKGSKKVS